MPQQACIIGRPYYFLAWFGGRVSIGTFAMGSSVMGTLNLIQATLAGRRHPPKIRRRSGTSSTSSTMESEASMALRWRLMKAAARSPLPVSK